MPAKKKQPKEETYNVRWLNGTAVSQRTIDKFAWNSENEFVCNVDSRDLVMELITTEEFELTDSAQLEDFNNG